MPNLALLRAIAWRRLAALRGRLAPSGSQLPAARGGASAAPGEGDAWLTPILVDYFGRDGSTTVLRLLASSPQIAVDGGYPYESNRLGRILATSGLLGGGSSERSPTGADAERSWSACSGELIAGHAGGGPPSHYAEKLIDASRLDLAAFPRIRMIVLLRDPRDTLVSIESFSRAVGSQQIGGGDGREEMLSRFVRRQRRRLRWIASLPGDERVRVVEYRDLVDDLDGVAARLAPWLGVDLDADEVARDFRLRWVHATSRDPRSSVGRWRQELDPAMLERLEQELGPEMRAAGFA